ncbi:restriction endonuclease subunit S [Candidatus Methylomicrobium oryzae]|uniref:restriction endonuclease subunit S n=1 Tax=Candidatus Methylomicrobium oryzae TaxID=2802053 RepID=UPI001922576F|nr:restriction endonuclease subunit S [Methylomicrobium sp. RS1]MBL1265843.1 restriction endonuclease subunit S [Methylomicrobium sp. RS1]
MDLKPGYKHTEIGVIPEEWVVKSTNQIGTPVRGGSPRPAGDPRYFNGSYIPWLTVAALTNIPASRLIVLETTTSLTEEGSLHSRTLTPGTLIIANSGATLGVAKILGIKCCANDGIAAILNLSNNVSPFYLAHFINTKTNYLREVVATGNGQPNLNTELIGNFKIPIPSTKAEQEAIAEALGDADALIESLEQLIAKKHQIKQGAMQELLTGKRRLPGFSEKWSVKRFDQLANIQRGASPRPIDNPIWFDENSSVGWVRISDITKSGIYLRETTQRLSVLGIQHSRPVSRDSLIMSICATVGRPIITEIDVCIHDGFVVFNNLRCNKYFLYYILSSIEDDWSRHGQTGSQMNLNTGLINRTEVPMPPTVKEQTAIAEILSDMDAEIDVLETKLTKARQIKQGMMQELLTGRIRLV